MNARRKSPVLDVDALLDDLTTQIIVCCGSGGVGKTTTSAALALRAAERGRRVVVMTIDPARRLAQSLGIEKLDNTPRRVPLPSETSGVTGGSLDAMMLDMKSTFDEVVTSQATPEKAAQILANPFYQALSSSFAGTQEYMAMERLGQIHRESTRLRRKDDAAGYDLIVVDTPPSRSALDFLDAPERLSSFLDGRLIRILTAPSRGTARLMTAGLGVVTGALNKVLGTQFLSDLQTFVAAFDTLFGGFRARAMKTYALLQQESTAFLVVAAPEPDALREAAYFTDRLAEDEMPLAGLVINRASRPPYPGLSAEEALVAADRLEKSDAAPTTRTKQEGDVADGPATSRHQVTSEVTSGVSAKTTGGVTAGLLRLHADRVRIMRRERTLRERFATAHPGVPTAVVEALATDVHDLDGLREIGRRLTGTAAS